MECDQCGAYRPRSGPCPECGAPPPGTFSSLRNYRDGSNPSASSRRGRAAAGGSSARNRRDNSGRWSQGSGDDWGDGGDYDEPPMRSSARNRRRNDEYQEVDLGRALVPTNDDLMPMMQPGAGVPALPGFPETEEEERALGIRHPVYIPATSEKRKRKLGSWRIISGVLSVMLICVATCAATGLLGRQKIEDIFQKPISVIPTPPSYDFSKIPATPVPTKGPAATFVNSGTTSLNNHCESGGACSPSDISSHFPVGAYVYVWVLVRGMPSGKDHTLSIQWYLNGKVVPMPPNAQTTVPLAGSKPNYNVYFRLTYNTPGIGEARVFLDKSADYASTKDDDPALVMHISFAVEPVSTATPGSATGTPGTQTPGSGTPTATPKSGAVQGGAPVARRQEWGIA